MVGGVVFTDQLGTQQIMAAKPIHLLLLGCRGVGKTKMTDRYADVVRPAPTTLSLVPRLTFSQLR